MRFGSLLLKRFEMSRTLKHTLNGKFNNGLIEVKEMPIFMLHYWNRINFWTGKYRIVRKEIREKESLKVDEAMQYV